MSLRRAASAALVLLPSLVLAQSAPPPPPTVPMPIAVSSGVPDAGVNSAPATTPSQKPAAVEQSGYLVVPFENKSPVKGLDWMASALSLTVAEKLESHPSLRPAYGASILDGLSAQFDAASIASRALDRGARYVVGGSFSRPNWKAEVTVRLFEVTSETTLAPVAEASRTGERPQLLEMLDDCLVEVLRKKGFAVEGEALAGIKRRPTKDLYALTLYGRALNQFYGLTVPTDAAGAEKLLQKVTVIDPKFAEAHRMLGVVLLARGENGRAAGQYAYALDLKPGYYNAIVGLARLYRAENRRDPSMEMAQKALEIHPYDDEMRFLLGQLEWEAGDLERSLTDLLKVTSEHPHHLGAHRTLAQVYAARGDIESLAAELEQVSLLAPDDLDARLDLGAALMRLGKDDKAIAAFEDVLKRKPRNAQALKLSGDLYRKVGDKERAIAAYEKMRRFAPEDPRPYFLLASVYEDAGNDQKAQLVLEDAAAQFHRYLGEVWIDLGALAIKRGELNRATLYLEKAVNRVPNRPRAHYNYALVLDATSQRDKALVELKTAAELDPEDADVPYLAGVILLRLGRLDEAKEEFALAVKLKPDHVDALHNLALLEDLDKRYGTERASAGSR